MVEINYNDRKKIKSVFDHILMLFGSSNHFIIV